MEAVSLVESFPKIKCCWAHSVKVLKTTLHDKNDKDNYSGQLLNEVLEKRGLTDLY